MTRAALKQNYQDTQKDSASAGIYRPRNEMKGYSSEHAISYMKPQYLLVSWLDTISACFRIWHSLLTPHIEQPSTMYGQIELSSTNDLEWGDPCQEAFEQLAEKNPSELIAWIESGSLQPPDLTFAAEILGRVRSIEGISPILLKLLNHQSPLVREGALYGLQHYCDDPKVEDAIRQVEAKDPSLAVRETAAEILGD